MSHRITSIEVEGFKSIGKRQHIDIRPLTILAGANSSGKSSIIQPLLLLKQTLDSPADPGALLLDGKNVCFTRADQLLCKHRAKNSTDEFSIRIDLKNVGSIEVSYKSVPGKGFEVHREVFVNKNETIELRKDTSNEDVLKVLSKHPLYRDVSNRRWKTIPDRCFLAITTDDDQISRSIQPVFQNFHLAIQSTNHLPGLRGNPKRTYPRMATGLFFPGTFDDYAAGLVFKWQAEKDEKLARLGEALAELGLSWKVEAQAIDDTAIELQVGRLSKSKRGGSKDTVSIADVGFGVSQVLPVLVAFLQAGDGLFPDRLVYIEQPEIHLHPKAQRGLAKLICDCAKRGVRLVIETHSALLLREVQTLVAKNYIDKDDVILHWFNRDENGMTTVTSAELDENGAFGDWPEDFDETALGSAKDYLDAVEISRSRK
ncbi:MAG: DUF3696 domain-containing protein [Planctomycetes bacterium]|nr:DUF3696 domain-containing protein [Planctomycetota bacterium]